MSAHFHEAEGIRGVRGRVFLLGYDLSRYQDRARDRTAVPARRASDSRSQAGAGGVACDCLGIAWPDWRRAPHFLAIGFAMLGFGNGGVVWAEQFMASGLVAVLVASTPFWMVGHRIVRRRRAPHPTDGWRAAGRLLGHPPAGLAGSGGALCPLAAGRGLAGWSPRSWRAWVGAGIDAVKQRLRDTDPLVASAFQMLAGGLVMLTVAAVLGEYRRLSLDAADAAAVVYLFFAGSLIGFVAYTYALAPPADVDRVALPVREPGRRRTAGHLAAARAAELADCGRHRHRPRGLRSRSRGNPAAQPRPRVPSRAVAVRMTLRTTRLLRRLDRIGNRDRDRESGRGARVTRVTLDEA